MSRVYVDANVFLYAIGTEHPYREPCRSFLRALGRRLSAETSAETLQEIVHHRRRTGDRAATEHGRRAAATCKAVHPLDREVMLAALAVLDDNPRLLARDAVHVATALANGLRTIVSADRDFDGLQGVARVDPADDGAVEALLKG